MKKYVAIIVLTALAGIVQISSACVGKTIHLGISNTANERLLAEMASILITERTGSSVKIDVYKDSKELYAAIRQGNVNVLFENVQHGAEVIGKSKETPFDQIKSEYRTKMSLTWLEPISGTSKYGPVITSETLANYPALPKLLNKLSGALANDTYTKLLKTIESDDKAKKVAKDFLKGKKLI